MATNVVPLSEDKAAEVRHIVGLMAEVLHMTVVGTPERMPPGTAPGPDGSPVAGIDGQRRGLSVVGRSA